MRTLPLAATLLTFALGVGTCFATQGRPCGKTAKAQVVVPSRYGIGFARAFIGGQDVVQVAVSDSRKTPYMEVKASDLLISYAYDKNGHLVDRKVWFEGPQLAAVATKRSML